MSAVIRKDITAGTPAEFQFDVRGYDYVVKNFTDDVIYVSFGSLPESTDNMICVPSNAWQRHICQSGYEQSVWVIGKSTWQEGVEVECLRVRSAKTATKANAPNPIMRNQVADYLKIDGLYYLMGVGFSTLDENPNAQTKQKTYVSQRSATTYATSYQTEFPYTADMIQSSEAVMALYEVGRNHLIGADAMFEYVRVDLFRPLPDEVNKFEARHFVVTNVVSSNPGEGGDPLTLSGTLHSVGDMTLGVFDTELGEFYPT